MLLLNHPPFCGFSKEDILIHHPGQATGSAFLLGGQDPFKIARGNNGTESYNRLIKRVFMRKKLQSLSNGIRLLRSPTNILESRIKEIPLSVDYVSETTEIKRMWRDAASIGRQVSSGQVVVEAGFTQSDDELIIEAGNHPNRVRRWVNLRNNNSCSRDMHPNQLREW